MKKLIFSALLLLSLNTFAQNQKWTIEQCIEYAIQNNLQIQQSKADVESAELGVTESRLDYLPTLGINMAHSANFGRSLDPTSYQFVDNETVNNLNGGLGAQATLFGGFAKKYTLDRSRLNLQSFIQSTKQMQNDISLSVTAAYLQILFNKEQLAISQSQLTLLAEQLVVTRQMVEAGSLALGSLFEVEAQLASEQFNKVSMDNQLAVSLLTITQLLEIRDMPDFDIEIPVINNLASLNISSLEDTYTNALDLPQIQVATLTYEMSKSDVSLAKSKLYPTLTFNANYGSSWSDARMRQQLLPNGTVAFTDYPFSSQLDDNISGALQFSLNIPVFTGLKTQIAIKTARWREARSELAVRLAENQLYKDIQQAQTDAHGALARYESATTSVKFSKESFDYAQKKFSVGATTSLDYNTARNNLLQALSLQTQAKYEYLMKVKILDFYNGIPITL